MRRSQPLRFPRQEDAPKTEECSEAKQLTVEMLSGQVVQIKVPAPHTVAQLKQCLEPRLGIPAFLQGIIVGAEELPDEAVVTGESVAFLQREPPMIEAEDFLRSMVEMSWEPTDIFRKWHAFDTYKKFPRLKSELLEWALSHRIMQNLRVAKGRTLKCLLSYIWSILESFSFFGPGYPRREECALVHGPAAQSP